MHLASLQLLALAAAAASAAVDPANDTSCHTGSGKILTCNCCLHRWQAGRQTVQSIARRR